jgi:hypothetical protein
MMALLYRRKAEMNHLVGQHPIVVEIGLRDMLTHCDPASRDGFTETHPVGNARAWRLKEPDLGVCHREPAEVGRRGSRGLHHPVEQGCLTEIERVRIEGYVD